MTGFYSTIVDKSTINCSDPYNKFSAPSACAEGIDNHVIKASDDSTDPETQEFVQGIKKYGEYIRKLINS